MQRETVEKFKAYFSQMKPSNDTILNEIYSDNVIFIDPIHQINGIENLESCFKKLDGNLIKGSFRFIDESILDDTVYLQWEMNLHLKRPRKNVKASGISVLTVEQKITKQDRKSTRLNSSHVRISYAVFCLKKKK